MRSPAQFASLSTAGLVLVGMGAMLTYAVDLDPAWIDLPIVGTIGLVLGIGCLIAAVVLALTSALPEDEPEPYYAEPTTHRRYP